MGKRSSRAMTTHSNPVWGSSPPTAFSKVGNYAFIFVLHFMLILQWCNHVHVSRSLESTNDSHSFAYFLFSVLKLIGIVILWVYYTIPFGFTWLSNCELLSKFGDISYQEYVSKGISHPVFYGDLVYKQRRVQDTPNFISSGPKIVKRLRRRQYDPLIIERTIGIVFGPYTALYRPFLKHCTLTNKTVGTSVPARK